MRVEVVQDTCCCSGLCALAVPDVFGQDEDGIVVLLQSQPPQERHAAVAEAARRCPTTSIKVS
nr:ferredoxin [Amycolatopsis rubida]